MKQRFLPCIFFGLFLFLMNGCSIDNYTKKKTATKLPNRAFSREELSEDIHYLITKVEKVNPFPYLFTSKDSIQRLADKLINENGNSPLDVYKKIMLLTAAYEIPHQYTNGLGEPYNNEYLQSTYFPLKITADDSVRTSSKFNDSITEGNVIIKINGLAADSLFRKFTCYNGGLYETKKKDAQQNFSYYLWLNKIHAPFYVEFIENGRSKNYTLQGKTFQNKSNSPTISALDKFITYKQLNDSIAYINFKSFAAYEVNKQQQIDSFLAETFSVLKTNKSKHLLIDLSENVGGFSSIGEKIIPYISSKPYRLSGGKIQKFTKDYLQSFLEITPSIAHVFVKKEIAKQFKYPHLFQIKKDTLVKYPMGALITPQFSTNRFEGKVFVLIGRKTFSSATMIANAIQDYELASLVGEPTAECPNDLGEIGYFRLPHSKIVFTIPTALFIKANGDNKYKEALIPQYPLKISTLTAAQKTEALIKFISKQQNPE